MGSRHGLVERAKERNRRQLADIVRELRTARVQHGLTLAALGAPAGLSPSQVSRIERGLVRSLDLEDLAVLYASVGLELSVRVFPAGDPVRDAAHLDLLDRFRAGLHASIRWRTEVPLPVGGDLRAWDAQLTVERRRVGVEVETRPRDVQALERRLALKMRDGEVDTVILVLADTRANRHLVRAHASSLTATFTIPGRLALQRLAAGVHPGGSALVLL